MPVIPTVAASVFKESVRDKVLYNLVLFAILLIGASVLIGQLTAGQDVKIIKDLGLAATSVFGLFMAVFIGVGLVWKEIERRSIYSLLAKPISRQAFILGKYLGLVLTLAVNLAVMALALFAVLGVMAWTTAPEVARSWQTPAVDPALLIAVGLILLQLMLVTAIALFFSTFSSPFLSAALTFGFYVIGHFSAGLRDFHRVVDSPGIVWLARALYYLLPNLAPFDVKAQVVHGQAVAAGDVLLVSAYALVYITMLLVASIWIFSRKDFK